MKRRKLLTSAVLAGLAGCSLTGPSDEAAETPSRTDTETPTATEAPTATEDESSDFSSERPTPTGDVGRIEAVRTHPLPESVPLEGRVELLEQPTSSRGGTLSISLRNTDSRSWYLTLDAPELPFHASSCSGFHLAVDPGSADILDGCPVGGSAVVRTLDSETLEPGGAVAGERVLATLDVADTCFAAGEHPFDNEYGIRKSEDDDESAIYFTWGFDVIVAE
jgi:hypothetical protein